MGTALEDFRESQTGGIMEGLKQLPTPCYVVDEDRIKKNLELLQSVRERSGCHILLAQKAFSMYHLYPLIGTYLNGTTASGLYEARLGAEEMGKENHVFAAAYREDEFAEIARLCDHIVFNSFGQLERFQNTALKAGKSVGIRINPECSTQEGHEIYDPCAPGSRMGITWEQFQKEEECKGADFLKGVEGIHFHTLCEQDADALQTTLHAVEKNFGSCLKKMKWLNMGGGHHITREGYDIELLISCIRHVKKSYGVEVYLEPGEAVALNAGFLVTRVLDVTENGIINVILDASAACHMPDVLEMPYRPPLRQAGAPGEKAVTCRLGGPTCLAGDIIGDYSFDKKPKPGDYLIFEDMAIYSMVKNNTFNGMKLPAIVWKQGKEFRVVKAFGYEDFKSRL